METYYAKQLQSGDYGIIVLFYPTTFSSAPVPESFLLAPGGGTNRELLGLAGENSGEPGLGALTLAIEKDPAYKLAARGPSDGDHDYGIFAIWQKVPA